MSVKEESQQQRQRATRFTFRRQIAHTDVEPPATSRPQTLHYALALCVWICRWQPLTTSTLPFRFYATITLRGACIASHVVFALYRVEIYCAYNYTMLYSLALPPNVLVRSALPHAPVDSVLSPDGLPVSLFDALRYSLYAALVQLLVRIKNYEGDGF